MLPRALCTALLTAALGLGACEQRGGRADRAATTPTPEPAPEAPPVESAQAAPSRAPRAATAHLFEWRWEDVALECERWLGPRGFLAVQVSPPQDHVVGLREPDPWWVRYQPVSYALTSRSGGAAAFAQMVQRCRAAGVEVWVDAVLNHMSGVAQGRGVSGARFTHYAYPAVPYEPADFHACDWRPSRDVEDFTSAREVRQCELLNLADLDTGAPRVQEELGAYLAELARIGVRGLRVDSAKHIVPAEIEAILEASGARDELFVFLEVLSFGDEAVRASDYLQVGAVTEFGWAFRLGELMRGPDWSGLEAMAAGEGMLPSERAVIFVANHDLERAHPEQVITWSQPELYMLAQVFTLAQPYGRVKLLSGYAFEGRDQAPPVDPTGATARVHQPDGSIDCGQGRWGCEHRDEAVAAAVELRARAGGGDGGEGVGLTHWWSQGRAVALGRGRHGFVIINAGDAPLEQTFATGLEPGRYCDRARGRASCQREQAAGAGARVDESGRLRARVEPGRAAVFIGQGG